MSWAMRFIERVKAIVTRDDRGGGGHVATPPTPKAEQKQKTIRVWVPDGRGGGRSVEMPIDKAMRYLNNGFFDR